MDEYIKREDALKILRQKQRDICPVGRCGHGYVYGRDRDKFDAIEEDIDTIENITAADVAPVVHGKWIEEPVTENNTMVKCSACGEYPEKKDQFFTPYCCLCGAKWTYRRSTMREILLFLTILAC